MRTRLRYYSWHDNFNFRAWKAYPGTRADEHGGHFLVFPKEYEVKVSPNKFVLRHFKIRSYEHGLRKVFQERFPRYSDDEVSRGWHLHYKNFGRDRSYFVIDSAKLTRYDDDGNWNLTKTFDGTLGAWPGGSVDIRILQLQKELEERTEWALRLEDEVSLKDTRIIELQKELDQLTEKIRQASSTSS